MGDDDVIEKIENQEWLNPIEGIQNLNHKAFRFRGGRQVKNFLHGSVAAARLGGNLVYGQKIGIDHTTSEKLPTAFTRVLSESDLDEGKPVRAEHNGTRPRRASSAVS